ncbi:MAG: hypothetical protein ACE5J1_00830, partial [Nitrospiria bacterium]
MEKTREPFNENNEKRGGDRFLSPEPVVVLEKAFLRPFKNFVATAKTCYSSKGIIRDEDLVKGYDHIAQSI